MKVGDDVGWDDPPFLVVLVERVDVVDQPGEERGGNPLPIEMRPQIK